MPTRIPVDKRAETRGTASRNLAFAWLGALALGAACAQSEPPGASIHAVVVEDVFIDARTSSPVVLLRERAGARRALPIWIGLAEARSIAAALEKLDSPRPNTHDLIKNLLEGVEVRVVRVVVTELRESTYYAVIHVDRDGVRSEVDSRPSDAIAVAIRTGAAIYASDQVLGAESPLGDRLDAGLTDAAPRVRVAHRSEPLELPAT